MWQRVDRRPVCAHIEVLQQDVIFGYRTRGNTGDLRSVIGNVLVRPLLRNWEIAFCGVPGQTDERVIPLADLTVTVRSGRVVLRSTSLDAEVAPRLSSAHAFDAGHHRIYAFLAALQSQGAMSSGAFSWGAFAGARSLPRVVLGPVVLSPRRFRLDASDIRAICVDDEIERVAAAQRLRAELSMPRYVGLEEHDQVLTADLDSALSIDALAGALRGKSDARFVELFLEHAELVVTGPDGRYAHEIVVPFLSRSAVGDAPAATRPRARSAPCGPATRTFAPGGEWFYAKIHAAPRLFDDILLRVVQPLLDDASDEDCGLYFVRYADPEPHLRVRFRVPTAGGHAGVGSLLALA